MRYLELHKKDNNGWANNIDDDQVKKLKTKNRRREGRLSNLLKMLDSDSDYEETHKDVKENDSEIENDSSDSDVIIIKSSVKAVDISRDSKGYLSSSSEDDEFQTDMCQMKVRSPSNICTESPLQIANLGSKIDVKTLQPNCRKFASCKKYLKHFFNLIPGKESNGGETNYEDDSKYEAKIDCGSGDCVSLSGNRSEITLKALQSEDETSSNEIKSLEFGSQVSIQKYEKSKSSNASNCSDELIESQSEHLKTVNSLTLLSIYESDDDSNSEVHSSSEKDSNNNHKSQTTTVGGSSSDSSSEKSLLPLIERSKESISSLHPVRRRGQKDELRVLRTNVSICNTNSLNTEELESNDVTNSSDSRLSKLKSTETSMKRRKRKIVKSHAKENFDDLIDQKVACERKLKRRRRLNGSLTNSDSELKKRKL